MPQAYCYGIVPLTLFVGLLLLAQGQNWWGATSQLVTNR
jgi:hypothetical protein